MAPSKKILVIVGVAALAGAAFAAGSLLRGNAEADGKIIEPMWQCDGKYYPVPCDKLDLLKQTEKPNEQGKTGTTAPTDTGLTFEPAPADGGSAIAPAVPAEPVVVVVTQPSLPSGGSQTTTSPQPANPQPSDPQPEAPAPQPQPQPEVKPQPQPEKDDKVVLIAPPKVNSSTPAQDAIGVALKPKISITFSRAMDKASTEAAFDIVSPAGFNNGAFSWDASGKIMSFTPAGAFEHGTTVQWKVAKSAKGANGEAMVPMAADATGSFRVLRIKTDKLVSQAAFDGTVYAPSVLVQGSHAIANGATFDAGTWQRGFLSFDLSGLPDDLKVIKAASLSVYQTGHDAGAYGPATGKLIAESVAFGSLDSSDFSKAGNQVCLGICGVPHGDITVATDGWKEVDMLLAVGNDWTERASRGERSQFRLRFATENLGEGPDVSASFASGNAAQNRPTLEITYEYP